MIEAAFATLVLALSWWAIARGRAWGREWRAGMAHALRRQAEEYDHLAATSPEPVRTKLERWAAEDRTRADELDPRGMTKRRRV